jgi:cytochrome c oxidase subunit IV
MSKEKLSFKQQLLAGYDLSKYMKSYIILIVMIPIAGISIECLYYGSMNLMIGSLAVILAVVFLPIGIIFGLLLFLIMPAYFITRRREKERKKAGTENRDSRNKNNNRS